ncbi:tetratricopeptide repeat protein [Hansschlegelia beijingensis]|uniref:tetratricopeptide repeat protein n=1 Tax=Hansschlegelia beijingensis TaxID=1133344 RepID=UPI00387EF7DD
MDSTVFPGAFVIRILILVLLIVAALGLTDSRQRIGRALFDAGLQRVGAFLLGGAAWNGAALYERGYYAEAAEAFRQADFAGQAYDLGTALARAGRLKEAVEAFDEALSRDPNDEDARYNLALVESLIRVRRGDGPDAQNGAQAAATENKRGGDAPPDAENDVESEGQGAAGDRDSGKQAEGAGSSKAFRVSRGDQGSASSQAGKATGSIGAAQGAGRTGDASMNVARQTSDQPALHSDSIMYKTVYASRQWLETLPDDPGVYIRRRFEQEREARREQGRAAPEMTDPW